MTSNYQDTPKVSVIIPVWNPGEGISRCVASLRGQTLKDIEMIFVDDCGTDGAMDVVRTAATDDPRIRIITNNENLGASASRNAAIEVARGEYISFVDADDYIDADFLEILYTKGVAEHLDIVKGGFVRFLENGEMIPPNSLLNAQIRFGLQRNEPLFSLFRYEFQSALYHGTLLSDSLVRFGQTAIGEDSTFLLKACHRARSFGIDDQTGYKLAVRETSATNAMTEASIEARLSALSEQAAYLQNHVGQSPFVVAYLLKKTKYYLSIQRHVSLIRGMENEADGFLSGLRGFVMDCPELEVSKENDIAVYALVEHGVNLTDLLSYVTWGRPSLDDYADFVFGWSAFVAAHPECKARFFNGYSWLLEELCVFVMDMDRLGYDAEEKTHMKALAQQVFSSICQDADLNPALGSITGLDALLFAMREQANHLGSLADADDKAVGYWTKRLKRFLSLQRQIGKEEGMGQTASCFLSALRDLASGFPFVDSLKEVDLSWFALVEYGENLAEKPYQSPWGKPDAGVYADLVAAWSAFISAHPDRKGEHLEGHRRFLEGFCAFVKNMEFLGYSAKEVATMKALCRKAFSDEESEKAIPVYRRAWNYAAGIWPMECLAHVQWDFEGLKKHVQYRLDSCCQQEANPGGKGVFEHETINNLGRMLRLTPEIKSWAESSQQVEVCGIYDYGAVLRSMLWGDYRTASNYAQMLANWQGFLAAHPDCEALYLEGYCSFLESMCNFTMETESRGRGGEETDKMKVLCQHIFSDDERAVKVFPYFKRLWYCAAGLIPVDALVSEPCDFGKLLSHVQYRVDVCNQLMANQEGEEARNKAENLGRLLRLTPEIKSWAESSQQVEVRGVYDHDAVLRSCLWGDYRTASNYAQMLANWQGFLAAHPDCEALYLAGYKNFLKDTQKFVAECERNGCPADGLVECKKALHEGWHGLPTKVRVRRRWNDLRGLPQRLIGKVK